MKIVEQNTPVLDNEHLRKFSFPERIRAQEKPFSHTAQHSKSLNGSVSDKSFVEDTKLSNESEKYEPCWRQKLVSKILSESPRITPCAGARAHTTTFHGENKGMGMTTTAKPVYDEPDVSNRGDETGAHVGSIYKDTVRGFRSKDFSTTNNNELFSFFRDSETPTSKKYTESYSVLKKNGLAITTNKKYTESYNFLRRYDHAYESFIEKME